MVKERMSKALAEKKIISAQVIEVKPIVRERPFFKKGHDGEFMYTGTNRVYQLPYSNSLHSYVKVFDSPEEQEAFEVIYNLPEGSLNIYDRNNPFWIKYTVELNKEGKKLDLTIPTHVMEYKVLKANVKRIAPDWASRYRAGYEFALVNDTQVREDDTKRSKVYEKAFEYFMEIRKSNVKMVSVLRLLGFTIQPELRDNTEYLKSEITKIMEQKERIKGGVKTIYDFNEVMEDKRFETKVLIYDAMDAKEIVFSPGGMFKIVATESLIGKNIDQAAEWLEDLVNQEDKIILQQRLKK